MQILEDDRSILILEDNQSILVSEDNQSYLSDLMSEVSLNEDICEDILELEEYVKSEANIHYPNEAYADLMSLVTKYKLSNVTGNTIIKFFNKHANLDSLFLPKSIKEGCNFMNNMNLPNFTFDKIHVITYNNNNYYLYHQSLIKCIKSILSIFNLSQNFTLSFKNFEIDGERAYSEQNTGIWWEEMEKLLPFNCKLLLIILYSDATNVDSLEKSNLHPIYIIIENIKTWRRNKLDVKQLLGFLPILKSNKRNSEKFKIAFCEAFHKSLKLLLESILTLRNGIELT